MHQVRIDNRIHVPVELVGSGQTTRDLLDQFTHANPKHAKQKAMGYLYTKEPSHYRMASRGRDPDGSSTVTLPRGGTGKLREFLSGLGVEEGTDWEFDDQMCYGKDLPGYSGDWVTPRLFPEPTNDSWDHQERICAGIDRRQQCIIRSPTGSGKTWALIMSIVRSNVPAIIVMNSTSLLKQWLEAIGEILGIPEKDVGIIGGGKFRLRPLTLAMTQSMVKLKPERWRQVNETFGYFALDECFEATAPIRMEDGTTKRIADVVVGDRVAGGRVTAVSCRSYSGAICSLDGVRVTPNHEVATKDGWVPVSAVCGSDIELYRIDGQDNVQGMRATIPHRLQGGIPCKVPTQADDAPGSLEQGTDNRRSACREICQRSARGDSYTGADCKVQGGDGKGPTDYDLQGEPPARSDQEVCTGGGTRGVESSDQEGDPGRSDDSVWERRVRQWWAENRLRGPGQSRSVGDGVCLGIGSDDQDGEAPTSLQDRCGSPQTKDSGGVRRQQSQGTGDGRLTEDLLPQVSWLDGSEIPGAGRLRLGHSRVQAAGVVDRLGVFNLETESGTYVVGETLVHNCHMSAANTFVKVVDNSRAAIRVGVSDDETRADHCEFLIYDLFGGVEVAITREELISKQLIHDVSVRIVPTDFRPEWYAEIQRKRARGEETDAPDFNRLLDDMGSDDARNQVVRNVVAGCMKRDETTFVFSHRIDHCRTLDAAFTADGHTSGLLLGGKEWSEAFETNKVALKAGELKLGVGTYKAIGTGQNIPAAVCGVAVTPIHGNRQFQQQVKGRICRKSDGKTGARLYVVWDRAIYGKTPVRNFIKWTNDTKVWDGTSWVEAERYLSNGRQEDGKAADPGIFVTR